MPMINRIPKHCDYDLKPAAPTKCSISNPRIQTLGMQTDQLDTLNIPPTNA